MTLDDVALKTNEFQQRRKLRLQQVREQSKDIAKKIRHRAKEEKLRHAVNVDNKKEKEYFECQEKFVKRLQQIYSENLKNIGKAHKEILENKEAGLEKRDLSKLRGKEAAAELKKKKQEKLDEQKKILDRKLKAREAANELSREKSLTVIQKLSKDLNKDEEPIKENQVVAEQVQNTNDNHCDLATNDIGIQWESPNPITPIPTTQSQESNVTNNNINTDKNKKINLFALSDEMTLNMNEELAKSSDRPAVKPSLTMVSEYLQNRNLRLREAEPVKKKPSEDLQSLKQTILQTRVPKTDGNVVDACHVLDQQVLPVPSWHSENMTHNDAKQSVTSNVSCLPINLNKVQQSSPKHKHLKAGLKQKSFRSMTSHDMSSRKSLVTVYDHTTKDSRCMPCGDGGFVRRDMEHGEDDAYSNAYKEASATNDLAREILNKENKDMRGKIAMNKQNVDKEYRETLSFLNSLQKEVAAPSISTYYMTEDQQKRQRDLRQKKLEDEFKKVQIEPCKHSCKHSRKKVVMSDRNSSTSPSNVENKFQYSWMPVPESDGSLAIHTLPNTVKEKGNTVKFSQVNSYHEYRSRHKHTPPTKDVNDKPKRVVETVVVEQNETSECNDSTSETSSVQDLNLEKDEQDRRIIDADRIIIYKILNSKKDKGFKERKNRDKAELKDTTALKNASTQNEELLDLVDNVQQNVSLSGVKEGLYKAVKSNGFAYKVTRVGSGVEMSQTSVKWNSWWDNIEASCVSDRYKKDQEMSSQSKFCKCSNSRSKDAEKGRISPSTSKKCDQCKSLLDHSSSASFKTARNDTKTTSDDGYIRLVDEANPENNKFYIGASGFLKDSDYEVIIQLRKKDGENADKKVVNEVQSVDSPITEVTQNTATRAHLLPDKDVATSNDSGICQEQAEVADIEAQNVECNKDINVTDIVNDNSVKAAESESSNKPTTCEKAVHTSFHNPVPAPEDVPKGTAKATSTCTQTNFSSPTPRPPFMHMSTSTSTAYMSPPDVILPRLLGHYEPTSEEPYDSSNSISNGQASKMRTNFFKCKRNKHKHCSCAKCELNIRCPSSRKSDSRKTTSTPPNTCRTVYRCDLQPHKTSKPQCRKHKKGSDTKSNKCKNNKISTSSNGDSPRAANVINMFNKRYHAKLAKSQLDPVVKKYINKLLNLNQEGLKAIEIINQDCSDVTTPSNSVVNVPSNVNKLNCVVDNKISLEQIKEVLKNEIINRKLESASNENHGKDKNERENMKQLPKKQTQAAGRKRFHKVKSLNISKKVLKSNAVRKTNSQRSDINSIRSKTSTAADSRRTDGDDTVDDSQVIKARNHNTSSPVSRSTTKTDQLNRSQNSITKVYAQIANVNKVINNALHKHSRVTNNQRMMSSDSDTHDRITSYVNSKQTHIMSTKPNDFAGSDIDCMRIAEDKIQNIEKLADLTEKCTKRISNLAKVLEEVRKNKSLVYSQISTTDVSSGSSDNKSDTSVHKDQVYIPNLKGKEMNENQVKSPTDTSGNIAVKSGTVGFMQLLKDIPKPDKLKPEQISGPAFVDQMRDYSSSNSDTANMKYRTKPPPALTRHFKHGQEMLVAPHELSTVVEVDSPMSVPTKSQSKPHSALQNNQPTDPPCSDSYSDLKIDKNQNMHKRKTNRSRTVSSEDSKLQMINMKQFNDIMLKPFVSLQEYAKQYNVENIEEGSILEDALKDLRVHEAISNSENSLPDVMTELLKRNVISEPFKFDSSSNNNSSLSSESTASLLALQKAQKKKRIADAKLKLQKSVMDTSETLSTSSNPDLENAFQRLGMGWASSTLKKTKERLALTSSSSTSSTSLRKFNMKSFNLELPTLGTDSISSLMSIKGDDKKSSLSKGDENMKNADQQTSPKCSMIVKEFLHNELAKKITFDNSKSIAAEEFMSLYETKMPEEIKNTQANVEGEQSVTSTNSPNNRARTSTPVHNVFKSTTYQTSSSSNTSNGLFSNADDLSSVKGTSNSLRNHSTSDKEDLTIPNYSLKLNKGNLSKSD